MNEQEYIAHNKAILAKYKLDSYGETSAVVICADGATRRVKFEHDDHSCYDPRDNDHESVMVTWVRGYTYGDQQLSSRDEDLVFSYFSGLVKYDDIYDDPDGEFPFEWHKTIVQGRLGSKFAMLCLYINDYGGGNTRIKYYDENIIDLLPFNGQYVKPDGVLYISIKQAAEQYGWTGKETVDDLTQEEYDRIMAGLKMEAREYAEWLEGNVYGIVVEELDEDGEVVETESCWGFIGDHTWSGIVDHLVLHVPELEEG